MFGLKTSIFDSKSTAAEEAFGNLQTWKDGVGVRVRIKDRVRARARVRVRVRVKVRR